MHGALRIEKNEGMLDLRHRHLVLLLSPPDSCPAYADALNKHTVAWTRNRLAHSPRLEFHLTWSLATLQSHGSFLRGLAASESRAAGVMRALQRALTSHQTDLFKLCQVCCGVRRSSVFPDSRRGGGDDDVTEPKQKQATKYVCRVGVAVV